MENWMNMGPSHGPRLGAVVAMLLELVIAMELLVHEAWLGCFCVVCYIPFSATRSVFASPEN